MNIFILNSHIPSSAASYFDTHVNKITLELAQMLSTVQRIQHGTLARVHIRATKHKPERAVMRHILPNMGEMADMYTDQRCCIYWETHANHPWVRWLMRQQTNYAFGFDMFRALGHEFEFRFDKPHQSIIDLSSTLRHVPHTLPSAMSVSWDTMPFAFNGHDHYIYPPGLASKRRRVVLSYRNYYMGEKMELAKYTRRLPPNWMSKAMGHQHFVEIA